MEIKILCQRDKKWAGQKLGSCNTTIGAEGCALTCVAMLAGITPDVLNKKPIYSNGCLMNWAKASQLLGLPYKPTRNVVVKYPVVAEVRLGKNGIQHFIVVDELGNQYDPWDGSVSKGKYKIVSYRNISSVESSIPDVLVSKKELIKALGRRIGVNYDESDPNFRAHMKNPNLDTLVDGFFDAIDN